MNLGEGGEGFGPQMFILALYGKKKIFLVSVFFKGQFLLGTLLKRIIKISLFTSKKLRCKEDHIWSAVSEILCYKHTNKQKDIMTLQKDNLLLDLVNLLVRLLLGSLSLNVLF